MPNRIEPLKNINDIRQIRECLTDRPRDLLLFDIVVSVSAPVKHLLQLKVKDLLGLEINDVFHVPVPGSKQSHQFFITDQIYNSFKFYVSSINPSRDDYIFKSRKGSNPLTIQSVSRLVKHWFMDSKLPHKGGILALHGTRLYNKDSNHIDFVTNPETNHHLFNNNLVDSGSLKTLDVIYETLLKSIVSGKLLPGEKIDIGKVASQLMVSPSPVREALYRLEGRGLVQTIKYRGTYVTQLSVGDLRELLQIRLLNECYAAEIATGNSTMELVNTLKLLHEDCLMALSNNNLPKLAESNKIFHFTLYEASQMPIIVDVISNLWDRFSPYLFIKPFIMCKKADFEMHIKIIEGLKKSDPIMVRKSVAIDIKTATLLLKNYFASQRDNL